MNPILEVKNVNYIYSMGTPFQHQALADVSFSVNRGEFIGIIGHTGSGKSTLMQQLNGLLKPTSGQILLDGEDIWADKKRTRQARFRVGLVFQYPEYQLFEETVYKDIAFGPKNMGLDEKEIKQRVADAARFVGLDPSMLGKSPFDLSGGQKRRAALAGIIAMRPEVLVLDEPAAGLDPMGRDAILSGICAYQKETGATIIIVSHSMEDMARYSDRLIVMNGGEIFMNGNCREVFSEADKLMSVGLDVPQITKFMLALKSKGIDVRTDIFTVDEAKAEILSKMGGRGNA